MMARVKCPCCGHYSFEDEDDAFFGYCPICAYCYDPVCVDYPNTIKGPNKVTLAQARLNYCNFGACDKDHLRWSRKPYDYELPKNNE